MQFSLSSGASVTSCCFSLTRSHIRRQNRRGSVFRGMMLPTVSSIWFVQLCVNTVGSSVPLIVPLFLI